jgi:hypothetical protein
MIIFWESIFVSEIRKNCIRFAERWRLLGITAATLIGRMSDPALAETCANGPNGVMFVTPACEDSLYNAETLF